MRTLFAKFSKHASLLVAGGLCIAAANVENATDTAPVDCSKVAVNRLNELFRSGPSDSRDINVIQIIDYSAVDPAKCPSDVCDRVGGKIHYLLVCDLHIATNVGDTSATYLVREINNSLSDGLNWIDPR